MAAGRRGRPDAEIIGYIESSRDLVPYPGLERLQVIRSRLLVAIAASRPDHDVAAVVVAAFALLA